METAKWVCVDFCNPDIYLTYVAEQLNISPGYLSCSFNKEVLNG